MSSDPVPIVPNVTNPVTTQLTFDYDSFRRGCAAFATGVTITTVMGRDGSPQGLTANSFTSVSWDPPLVLISIDRKASVHEHFLAASHYAIHVLTEEQQELSVRFASPIPSRFEGLDWSANEDGVPILPGALALIECAVYRAVEAGDHTLFLGSVTRTACRAGRPLLYFNSSYRALGA